MSHHVEVLYKCVQIMVPSAKGIPQGHTFYIVLIRGDLKLSPSLKLKCITPLH